MKVVLATAPVITEKKFRYPTTYPPLGILYIASYLRNFDSETDIKIIDGSFLNKKDFLRSIEKENPDLMGLSFTTLDCENAEKISRSIKNELPNVLLVAGGPHPTAMPENTLRNGAFDLAVVGEGEDTFKEIVQNFRDRKRRKKINKIKGLSFLRNGKFFFTGVRNPIENLDFLPFPARGLINIKDYHGYYLQKNWPDTNFLSSRGCPFNCIFCSNPVWRPYKPRIRTPTNILKELAILKQEYKVKELFDYCDEFNFNQKNAIEICDAIRGSKLDITFKTHVRADNVSNKFASSMGKAGYWLALMGMESSSDCVLRGINKGISIRQIIQACKKLKKYDIKVGAYFMAFNVWLEGNKVRHESIKDVKRTVDFIKYLKKNKLINFTHFGMATPMPGSKLYDIAKNYGLIKSEDYSDYNTQELLLNLNGVNEQEFKKIKKSIAFMQSKEILFSGNLNPRHVKFLFEHFIKSFI